MIQKKYIFLALVFLCHPHTHILYWSRTTLQQRRCNKGLFIHVCLLIIQFCFSNSCLQHVTCTLNAADEIGWWWKKIWIGVIAVLYLPFLGGGGFGCGRGAGYVYLSIIVNSKVLKNPRWNWISVNRFDFEDDLGYQVNFANIRVLYFRLDR